MTIELKKAKTDKRDEYLYKLTNQFKEATGLNKSISIIQLETELESWIKERRKVAENYLMLLDSIGFEYNHKMTAEIGKGVSDTLVNNNDTTIITPYTFGITNPRTIKASLEIKLDHNTTIKTSIPKIDSIMTQNPYSSLDIKNWDVLFNERLLDVTLGIYGKTYDKDKNRKIKELESFKKKVKC